MIPASVAPSVEPCAIRSAVAIASIAAAPVTNPPVCGACPDFFRVAISFLTPAFGSSPHTEA